MIRSLLIVLAVLISASPALAVTFDHAEHLIYLEGEPCSTCHVEGAASIVPERQVCLECHDEDFAREVELPALKTHGPVWALNHRPFAKGNTYDCSACHQQVDCLECHKSGFADEQGDFGNNMINVHRSDFHVTHPIAARTDPQLCTSCHERKFCSDCHDNFAPEDLAVLSHRRGFRNITVSGAPHAQFVEILEQGNPDICLTCHPDSRTITHDWGRDHAREARKNLVTCQACHPEGEICLQCHSARSGLRVNPHPDDWGDIKGRLDRASDSRTCRRCH